LIIFTPLTLHEIIFVGTLKTGYPRIQALTQDEG
jgi:hypothetical protein